MINDLIAFFRRPYKEICKWEIGLISLPLIISIVMDWVPAIVVLAIAGAALHFWLAVREE